MKKEIILITAMLLMILVLAISSVKAQNITLTPLTTDPNLNLIEWNITSDSGVVVCCWPSGEIPKWQTNEDNALHTDNVKKWIKEAIDTISRENVYVVDESNKAQLITTSKIIISNDYVNVLLEPIPGKVTRWTIIREEHDPEPVVIRDSVMVDGRASTFSGVGWVHAINQTLKWYNKTISYNNVIGATIEYAFTGNRINWYAERKLATHGTAEIAIDGIVQSVVNLRNGTQALDIETNLPIFKSGELTNGPHIIRIRILEARYIVHDGFKVFSIR